MAWSFIVNSTPAADYSTIRNCENLLNNKSMKLRYQSFRFHDLFYDLQYVLCTDSFFSLIHLGITMSYPQTRAVAQNEQITSLAPPISGATNSTRRQIKIKCTKYLRIRIKARIPFHFD